MIDFWNFIVRAPFGPSISGLSDSGKTSINWFMPPMTPNSGGHINIFRFLLGLQARGFDCRVVVVNDGVGPMHKPVAQLAQNINDWFGDFRGGVYYLGDEVPAAHVSFATGWQTAYGVKQFRGSPIKCYFVQDYEPLFFPASSEAVFAEDTYRFGFTAFTAGGWLADMLSAKYGMTTHPLSFSYDRSLYVRTPRRDRQLQRLFCYVRPETARRGFEMCMLALSEVFKRRPSIEFILAGGQVDQNRLPFPALLPGAIPLASLPDLYSQCDAALVVSLTNLSLLPLELMACGVPIVSNTGPNVEWLLDKDHAVLARPRPTDLAEGVLKIFNMSAGEREAMVERGMRFVARTSWETEIDKLAAGLTAMIGGQDRTAVAATPPRARDRAAGPRFSMAKATAPAKAAVPGADAAA